MQPTKWRWGGWFLGALVVLFLLWDGVMKLIGPAVVLESFARFGYPEGIALSIGILQLVCLALLWGGLYLRDDRLRTLIPLRSQHST